MLSAAVVRELVAAGLAGDALCAACERIEAASQPVAATRSAGAIRTARWRAAKRHEASHVTPVTSRDVTPPPSEVPEVFPPHTPSFPNPPSSPCSAPKGASLSPRKKPRAGADERVTAADLGVSEQALKDWQAVRTAKKAGPVTWTVVNAMRREAERAEISVAEAVRIATERGWKGFNAKWVTEGGYAGRKTGTDSAAALAAFAGGFGRAIGLPGDRGPGDADGDGFL